MYELESLRGPPVCKVPLSGPIEIAKPRMKKHTRCLGYETFLNSNLSGLLLIDKLTICISVNNAIDKRLVRNALPVGLVSDKALN